MSTIYDLANIQAGDPQGQVGMAVGEAISKLEQYKHQKEMIEEINQAYKSAEDKMKKGKKGFGLAGSLLGGLLGMSLGPLGAALVSAGTAGLAEKVRQNTYDPTKELEKIDKKYKGRKLGEGVGGVIDEIQSNLDSAIVQDAITSGLSSYALGNLELVPGETTEILGSEEVAGGLISEDFVTEGLPNIADADGNVWQIISEPEGHSYALGHSPGTTTVQNFAPDYAQTAVDYTTGPPSFSMSGLDKEALSSLAGTKGIDISKLTKGMKLDGPLGDFLKNNPWMGQTLQGLLRYGGTPLLQDLMMSEYQAPQFAAAPFRNPFGGY
tara:strand:- start:6247 stop:7218 length:972 start_codon:yes stop_codon:yes gene_type:complete